MILRRAAVNVLLLVGTGLLAFACGSATDAAAGDDPARKRIAVIPKGTAHEFWKSVHAGALHSASELGCEVLWLGPQKEGDRDAQVRIVENFVTQKVDAIVLMPVDDTALVRPARRAAEKDIPVVVADSGLDWDGSVSFVATDNHEGGRLGGEKLAELLGGQGRVILLRYKVGSASTDNRERGFLAALQGHPGIEIISDNQYAGDSKAGALKASENLLANFPDVDGIFCPNESSAYGMMRALDKAKTKGSVRADVRFVGFDSSENLLAGLEKGQIDALVLQDPVNMGALAVRAAVEHLEGKSVEARIDTGVRVATRENMQEPEIAALLDPDLSVLDE